MSRKSNKANNALFIVLIVAIISLVVGVFKIIYEGISKIGNRKNIVTANKLSKNETQKLFSEIKIKSTTNE